MHQVAMHIAPFGDISAPCQAVSKSILSSLGVVHNGVHTRASMSIKQMPWDVATTMPSEYHDRCGMEL